MTSDRRPKMLLLRLLNAAILIMCLASVASGEQGRHGQGVGGCGPCPPRLVAARRSSALLPGNSIIVGPVPILGCRRSEICPRGSSSRSDADEGSASILLSLRGGRATKGAATSSKPKSAPNPRKDKGSSVADGRKKASMSASVFNLVNNVAGAFILLVLQAAPLRAVVCDTYYVLYQWRSPHALSLLAHGVCTRACVCRSRDLGFERGTGHGNRMDPQHRHVRRPWRTVGPLLFDCRDGLRGARPKGL
jgi:hypothetical protein